MIKKWDSVRKNIKSLSDDEKEDIGKKATMVANGTKSWIMPCGHLRESQIMYGVCDYCAKDNICSKPSNPINKYHQYDCPKCGKRWVTIIDKCQNCDLWRCNRCGNLLENDGRCILCQIIDWWNRI